MADEKIKQKKPRKAKKDFLVIKRDGRTVPFKSEKILNVLKQAYNTVYGEYDEEELMNITSKILKTVQKLVDKDEQDNSSISVEAIQDVVEDILLKQKEKDVAKEYIRYRAKRTQIRDANNDLMKLYDNIYFTSAKDMELKRDNANVNGDTSMGIMLKCGCEGNKYFILNHFLKKEYAEAHITGMMHMHDLDFSLVTSNCLQLDLGKLFKNGFSTGHGYLREPNNIRAYAALACIAVQSNQNEQFGGQSINAFDYYMAPGVRKSFAKLFKHNLAIAESIIVKEEDIFAKLLEIKDINKLPKYNDEESLDEFTEAFLDKFDDEDISAKVIRKSFKFAFKQANKDVEEETHQAMEAVVHNFNTLDM